MNEKIEVIEDTVKEETGTLLENVRKVVLAGVGAIASAQESAEKQVNSFVKDVEAFVNKLVERGEIADKEGRELITEVVEKRKAAAEEVTAKLSKRMDSAISTGSKQAESTVSGRFDKVINRFNVPTKRDLDTLTKKIAALANKVDQLKEVQKEAVAKQASAAANAAEYKKEASAAKRKATIAEKEAATAKEQLASLKKELTAAKKKATTAKKEVTALGKELTEAKKEAAAAKRKATIAEKEAASATKEVAKAQKAIEKISSNGTSKAAMQAELPVEEMTA